MNAVRKPDPNTPTPSAVMPGGALIVSAHQGHSRVDRKSLSAAQVAFSRTVSSSAAAMDHLARHGADVVLVDETLDDATGWDFVRALKADPALADIPVIMLGAALSKPRVLEAIGLGCTGFLLRPYSMDAFLRHLTLARQSCTLLRQELDRVAADLDLAEQGSPEQALPGLQQAVETPDDARRYYEQGLRDLAKQRYTQAVEAFTAAVRISVLLVEGHMGLARCWLGLGDEVRYRKALTSAADIVARTRRFERYKAEFLDILRTDKSGFNPFVSLGMRLARGMDWQGSVMALRNALWLNPNDAKACVELAKAFHFTRKPEQARQYVAQALTLAPHDQEALDLHERWTGQTWREADADGEDERRDANGLPLVMNAVLYLAGVVTEGLHRLRRHYA